MTNSPWAYSFTMRFVNRTLFDEIMTYIEERTEASDHDHFIHIEYSYSNQIGKEGTLEVKATKSHYEPFMDVLSALYRFSKGESE